MKTKIAGLIGLLMVITLSVFAGSKTEKFKVYGNCGMCESRIEKAAESVDGVSEVDWNKDTKIISVTYDESKTNLQKIELAIADAGHDTENFKAKDEVYNELPGCCQYDRNKKSMGTENHSDHSESGCTRSKMNAKSGSCCSGNTSH